MDEQRPENTATNEANNPVSEPAASADYAHLLPPKGQRSKTKKLMTAVFAVLAVVLAGAGIYWQFLRDEPAPVPAAQPAGVEVSTPENDTFFSEETKTYTSSTFSLSVEHPADWVVNDEATDHFTITSPSVELPEADSVRVVLTVRSKAAPLPGFDAGNAIAIRASELLTYANPSSVQRGQTHLSFLQYAETSATDAMDALFITGDTGYLEGQAVPKADLVPVEPIISITFEQNCSGELCGDTDLPLVGVPVSLWDDENFSQPLKDMLQSLSIR